MPVLFGRVSVKTFLKTYVKSVIPANASIHPAR